MMEWLSKLNPDTVVGAFSFFGTLAYWLYNKARGRKTESFEETIGHTFDNFAAELLDSYLPTEDVVSFLKRARVYITERAWTVLSKRGVPRNAVTERFFNAAIERVTSYIGNKAAVLRMPLELQKLNDRANQLLQSLNPPASSGDSK